MLGLVMFEDGAELRGPNRDYRTFMQAQLCAALGLGLMRTAMAPVDVTITRHTLLPGKLRDVYEVGCAAHVLWLLTVVSGALSGAGVETSPSSLVAV